MNTPNAIIFSPQALLFMENMNAGFVAEGLTSRKRAITRYMETKGTRNDRKALKILKDIGALSPLEEKHPMAVWQGALNLLPKLGSLVGEKDGRIMRPEASPLALYAMALCALEPRLVLYDFRLGWDCLMAALNHGCDPARALYADLALRKPLEPEDTGVLSTLLQYVRDAVFALLKAELRARDEVRYEAVDEDLLLVLGRRFALCDMGEKELSGLVQGGLKSLAQMGHVDAVRLLALSHSHVPSPETLWAREQIGRQARAGQAHAMLVMGQHLARFFPFWLPKDDSEENLEAARDLFQKCARKNDPWAALALAYISLWESEEAPENRDKARDDENRALKMLETLAHERNFAPARAMLGVWHCAVNKDVETAWPLLRDASAQMVSRQCEAACANFLVAVLTNDMFIQAGMAEYVPLLDNYDDRGRTDLWLMERRLAELDHCDRFGHNWLVCYRLLLAGQQTGLHAAFSPLDDPEERGLKVCLPAIIYGGRLAIHFYLLVLAWENTRAAQVSRNYLKLRIQADIADGNEDCILADMLFTKRLFDASPCAVTELEGKLLPFSTVSYIATTALAILHIHMYFAYEEDGFGLDEERLEISMTLLRLEYVKAGLSIDLPVLCVLPVLFKYAKGHFSPKVVRKSLEYVTLRLFGRKLDLKGLVAVLNNIHYLQDLDMNRLWENLGLVPDIDFAPRAMPAGYEASAMRSRRSAEARKKVGRKKDKRKKARRGRR